MTRRAATRVSIANYLGIPTFDWRILGRLDAAAEHHRAVLGALGAAFGWNIGANQRVNTRGLTAFKSTLNRVAPGDLPTAFKVIAHFSGRPSLTDFVTEARMPHWVKIWRLTPPGRKPLDVSFNGPKLKPHFEKHICHNSAKIAEFRTNGHLWDGRATG